MAACRVRTIILATVLALASAEAGTTEPLDLGIEEEVDVRLVLVDLLVHDRQDRTVPDLTKDDFVVVVSGKEMEIDSLDLDCPAGAAEDPRPGEASEPLPAGPTARPRQIVLAFDYYHMENAADAIENVLASLDKWSTGDEVHMVVAFAETVRVETPFTSDIGEIRATLRRMRDDPVLYFGHYEYLTERRFFKRMAALFDLLELQPGRKMIVLFSGPFAPDGFYHDPEFKELSAMATVARTAVYPVDTGGLRVPTDPLDTGVAGPPELRRLANETGGRMTTHTNEIGLAYAKAHRDLSCTYTLGFYDDRPRRDRERRFTIRVKDRRGLRVVYPEHYMIRSAEKKRKSLFRTAATAPHTFVNDRVAADLFVVGPRSKRRWNAILAVEVCPDVGSTASEGESWPLRGIVRKPNGTIVHSFKRQVPIPAPGEGDGSRPPVTLLQEMRLRPGEYEVSAVLSSPESDLPLVATRQVVVPEIRRTDPESWTLEAQ